MNNNSLGSPDIIKRTKSPLRIQRSKTCEGYFRVWQFGHYYWWQCKLLSSKLTLLITCRTRSAWRRARYSNSFVLISCALARRCCNSMACRMRICTCYISWSSCVCYKHTHCLHRLQELHHCPRKLKQTWSRTLTKSARVSILISKLHPGVVAVFFPLLFVLYASLCLHNVYKHKCLPLKRFKILVERR